ncbi:MutS-related protein [Oxalobacteraceae bacterium A2-2]
MSLSSRLIALLPPAQPEPIDFPFVPSDVALYRRIAQPDRQLVDAATWDDMLLQDYSAVLARQTGIHGQQELHRRLHGGDGPDTVAASAQRVRELVADPQRQEVLRQACLGLRRTEREVSETLFGPELPATPGWVATLAWFPHLFLLSAVAALVTGFLPLWGVALAVWLVLMGIQARWHEAVSGWKPIVATLQQQLRAHSLLARLDDALAEPFRAGAEQVGRINRALPVNPVLQLPLIKEYADWIMLADTRHYFASRALVRREIASLRASFRLVAGLEADLALARHLSSAPRWCWAEAGEELRLEQVVHPLLEQAAPLTFAPGRQGVFISGQNGIGKSTLLRTVGLNLVAARAFGFCYAQSAVTPLLPVYSSMQPEDSLGGGESLYLAELRRAQELLALSQQGAALFLIDEIFRGTNHLESVSAAAAVLDTLAQSGRVIVSSHNLVLASLLADSLEPWCVSAPDGDRGRLQLRPGVLQDTNGLALLATRGFDPGIQSKARRVHDWLSDYLAHPADCRDVLAAAPSD